MRRKLAVMVAGIGLLLSVEPVFAHHSFAAEFDAKRPVKLRGTITRMEWINPHAWIHIDVKGPDGNVVNWMIEAGTPNTLFRRGFTKDSLVPGMEILVDGYVSKDGLKGGNGRGCHVPGGAKVFSGLARPGRPIG